MVVTDVVMTLLFPAESVIYVWSLYTVMSCLFEVKSQFLPRGALDDLMHYCARPKAEGNSASVLHGISR